MMEFFAIAISSYIDVLLIDSLLDSMLYKPKRGLTINAVSWVIMFVIISSLNFLHVVPIAIFTISTLISLVYAILFFSGNILTKLFISCLFPLIVLIGDYFTYGLLSLLLSKTDLYTQYISNRDAGVLIFSIYCMFIVLITKKVPLKKRRIPSKDCLLLISIPLSMAILATLIIEYLKAAKDISPIIFMLPAGFIALLLFITLYFYQSIARSEEDRIGKAVLASQLDQYSNQYDAIGKAFQEFKVQRHNMRHHISCMHGLAKNKQWIDLSNYLTEIDETTYSILTLKFSGNIVIDMLVEMKMYQAKTTKIKFTANAAVPSSLEISMADLCIVLSNALDNAFEACVQVERIENRSIDLSIFIKNAYLYIVIKNTFQNMPIKREEKYITSKQNPDLHGLGLDIIDAIVRKYNGHSLIEVHGGIFVFTGIMQIKPIN